VRDFQTNTMKIAGGSSEPLDGPSGNFVIMDLEAEGNYVAARPSGTEPKVKFYMFTYVPADQIGSLDTAKSEMQSRLDAMQADLAEFAASVK
jgi:phosphoglucomutase/phosphomannomutase